MCSVLCFKRATISFRAREPWERSHSFTAAAAHNLLACSDGVGWRIASGNFIPLNSHSLKRSCSSFLLLSATAAAAAKEEEISAQVVGIGNPSTERICIRYFTAGPECINTDDCFSGSQVNLTPPQDKEGERKTLIGSSLS